MLLEVNYKILMPKTNTKPKIHTIYHYLHVMNAASCPRSMKVGLTKKHMTCRG